MATSKPSPTFLNATDLKTLIEKTLDDSKAEDIETIDLRGQSSLADFMIVASGQSGRQISGFAAKLRDKLAEHNLKIRTEGESQGDWVVIDAIDVIIHLFRPEVREFYNIEKMWRSVEESRAAAV